MVPLAPFAYWGSIMSERKINFNAGPTALPLAVLQRVQGDLVDFGGMGLSLLEMSHRGAAFGEVIEAAKASITGLYGLPDTHEVMFLQGGASLQFAMIPLNLGVGGTYLDTGTWSQRAIAEANTVGRGEVLWSGADTGFRRVPQQLDLGSVDPASPYLHYTTNNTIYGTQYHYRPEVGVPLIADMSSDFISRPVDISAYDLIYAGAQKNAGPSGVVILIARKDLVRTFRGDERVPKILRYQTHAEKGSMYNTPNTFGVWVVGLVAEWVAARGGLRAMAAENEAKAMALYQTIDEHPLLEGHAHPDSRSRMNVTFRARTPEHEAILLERAAARGIMGLKGHRSVGGLRASIYNAVPRASVDTLIELLREFKG